MVFIGVLIAILVFSVIILVHEFGHFKASRFFGVKVEEFGLGIPPRAKILKKDKLGTIYSLNWLPLGGFVKLTGENLNTFLLYNKKGKLYNNKNLEKSIKNKKPIFDKNKIELTKKDIKEISKKLKENYASYNLSNKPAWQQSIIILAGVFMNFLFASIVFSILFFIGVKPIGINNKIETTLEIKTIPTVEQSIKSGLLIKKEGIVMYPIEDSISLKAGIKTGDILTSFCYTKSNGESINCKNINKVDKLIKIIKNSASKKIVLQISRKDKIIDIEIIPSSKGKIGSYLSENIEINESFKYKYSFLESIKYGFLETYNHSIFTIKALGVISRKIFNPKTKTERQEAISEVSGPIGFVDFISKSISAGFIFIIIIGAIISVNLGVFNLLPIPALDGGRFIFIIINSIFKKIFGKKGISVFIESMIHATFFLILIILSLLIAYNDIVKIITN